MMKYKYVVVMRNNDIESYVGTYPEYATAVGNIWDHAVDLLDAEDIEVHCVQNDCGNYIHFTFWVKEKDKILYTMFKVGTDE